MAEQECRTKAMQMGNMQLWVGLRALAPVGGKPVARVGAGAGAAAGAVVPAAPIVGVSQGVAAPAAD
eukprot:10603502-Heterocapsa_arctica.AAC.1